MLHFFAPKVLQAKNQVALNCNVFLLAFSLISRKPMCILIATILPKKSADFCGKPVEKPKMQVAMGLFSKCNKEHHALECN